MVPVLAMTEEYSVSEFLQQAMQSAPALLVMVCLLAAVESLVVIGLLVPGMAGLVALTLAAAAAGLPPFWWWLAGALGAIAGDGISFHIGRFSRQGLHQWPVLKDHPQWLERGYRFFHDYGVVSIAIGRFVGPLRPLIPAVAAVCDMPAARFWWVNILSGCAWAAAWLLPVYWLGKEALQHISGPRMLLIFAVVCVLAFVVSSLLARRSK